MIWVLLSMATAMIFLFFFLYSRIQELTSRIDTLTSNWYKTNKELNDFSIRCMNRHSANRGVDFPNSRR